MLTNMQLQLLRTGTVPQCDKLFFGFRTTDFHYYDSNWVVNVSHHCLNATKQPDSLRYIIE